MKIIKGSFGVSGNANIKNDALFINENRYYKDSIKSANAEVLKEKQFGAIGFIIGGAILGVIGFMILNIVGAAIGVAMAFFGSKYSTSQHVVTLTFADDKSVTLSGRKSEINSVFDFMGTSIN
jgi:hypothetical protein